VAVHSLVRRNSWTQSLQAARVAALQAHHDLVASSMAPPPSPVLLLLRTVQPAHARAAEHEGQRTEVQVQPELAASLTCCSIAPARVCATHRTWVGQVRVVLGRPPNFPAPFFPGRPASLAANAINSTAAALLDGC
jgi:hypothetical protein